MKIFYITEESNQRSVDVCWSGMWVIVLIVTVFGFVVHLADRLIWV
jgi:hypothetical protein